jgi:hypothetical protein
VSVAPTSTTIVTADELEQLLGLTPEEADRCSQLVQIAVEAYLWPAAVPDPVPPPMHAVGLALAARFAGAQLTKAGAITSETLGSYSYRLASPLTFDNVMTLMGEFADALVPWAPTHQGAYELDVSGGWPPSWWPADWWQRNLERLDWAADYNGSTSAVPAPAPGDYLTVADADARYSRLEHAHARFFEGEWNFSTNTAAGDPGVGKVRLDNADSAAATELYVDAQDTHNDDWTAVVVSLVAGDSIRLQSATDSTQWDEFTLQAAPVDEGGWLRIPVARTATSGTLAYSNNQRQLVYLRAAGHP